MIIAWILQHVIVSPFNGPQQYVINVVAHQKQYHNRHYVNKNYRLLILTLYYDNMLTAIATFDEPAGNYIPKFW